MIDDLPFYFDNIVELMAFTGLRRKDIVYKISTSKDNSILCNVDNQRYKIFYFL